MRDKQKSKVYAWENAASWSGKGKNELDDTQVLHIVKQLDTKLKRVPTTVRFTNRSHQNATAQTWGNIITLPRSWARCWSVVLHEYAHLLTAECKHGPVFVSTFCVLLKNFHPDKPTYKELSAELRERNIDFKSLQNNKYEKKCNRIKITLTNVKKPKDYDFLENTYVRVPVGRSSKYYVAGSKATRVEELMYQIQETVYREKMHTELGEFSAVKARFLFESVKELTVGDIKYLVKTGRLIAKDSC